MTWRGELKNETTRENPLIIHRIRAKSTKGPLKSLSSSLQMPSSLVPCETVAVAEVLLSHALLAARVVAPVEIP